MRNPANDNKEPIEYEGREFGWLLFGLGLFTISAYLVIGVVVRLLEPIFAWLTL